MRATPRYELPDRGADTVEANLALGLPVDARGYAAGAQVLADLGIRSVRPLGNNPAEQAGLEHYGVTVARRLPLQATPTEHNVRELRAKRDRMDHRVWRPSRQGHLAADPFERPASSRQR